MNTPVLNVDIKGQGPTLVLIHGVAGSLHIWDPIYDELAKTHTTVRFDLLGYGHSPKPRINYTIDAHVEAIRNTLHERGLKPPYTLIGLSMGVNLALEYAARWSVEVQALIGIGFPYYPSIEDARKGLHNNTWTALTIEHPIASRVIIPTIWWLGRHHIIPAGSFSKIYSPLQAHETLLNPYYAFRSTLWNTMVNNPQTKVLEASSSLGRLFIHGEDDVWASPAIVAQALKPYAKSSLTVIPKTGHNVVVLQPEATLAAMREYLSH